MEVLEMRNTHVVAPLTEAERQALRAVKRRGIQKGHWVAQAIREKLERDGLLVADRP